MKIKRSIGTLALAALMGTTVLVTSGLAHGDQATQTRDLDKFNRVVIQGTMDAYASESVKAELNGGWRYYDLWKPGPGSPAHSRRRQF